MEKKGEAIARVLKRLQRYFGDIQIIARTVESTSVPLTRDPNVTTIAQEDTQILVRRFGSKSTGFQVARELDMDTLVALVENAPRIPPSAATTPTPGHHAAGLDLRLHRNLGNIAVLTELAGALESNVRHESERYGITANLSGALKLWRQVTFVGSGSDMVGAFQGGLEANLEINEAFGDRVAQVHTPESFLPIALIGARCLQRYGHLPCVAGSSLSGLSTVVLHPRALEALLRQFSLDTVRSALLADPKIVGCDGLFLVDDPTIEGLWTARGFDDTGAATARQALVLRGQVASRVLSSPTPGQEWFRSPLTEPNFDEMPSSSFSGILVGRGESSLQDILTKAELSVVVNEWDVFRKEGQLLGFSAVVKKGVLMRAERPVGLITPGSLKVEGTLFGSDSAVFTGAKLSRELQDTGSAVAPFVGTTLTSFG